MLNALIVALVAGATIGLELIQTRVLSVLYYNHVVYLTVTIALMGFGISGVIVSLAAKSIDDIDRLLNRCLLGFAVTLLLCIGVASHLPAWLPWPDPILKLVLSYLILVVPFLFSGSCLGLLFMRHARQIHLLYGADLSASALVVLAFGVLLQPLGGPGFLVGCGVAATLAYVLHGIQHSRSKPAIPVTLGLVVMAGAVLLQPVLISSQPEPYKTAGRFFEPEHKAARLENSAWTTITKIDVWSDAAWDILRNQVSADAARKKMITQDADAHTILWDASRLDELRAWADKGLPYPSGAAAIAYLLEPRVDQALVIGVGGGNDIVTARAYGAKQITGLELNPATVDFVSGPYRSFTSWPDWEGVSLIRGEGRNYVRGRKDAFDTLVMSGVDTFSALNSGAYVLSENYLYTVEAIRDYLDCIKRDGIVSIYRWFFFQQPRESLRLAGLVKTALEDRGIQEAGRHIMVIGEVDWAATLFRKTAFSAEEVRRALDIVDRSRQLAMVFVPKVLPPTEQAAAEETAFRRDNTRLAVARKAYSDLLGSMGSARAAFEAAYPYRVDPVYDSRPFFFEYAKSEGGLFDIDLSQLRGNAVHYTLHIMLVVLSLFSLLAMMGPLVMRAREGIRLPGVTLLSLFFSSLGVGFMMIEISLMQWLNLFLGDPMRSLMVVLGGLLLFAGLGSITAGQIRASNARKIMGSMIAVAVLVPVWLGVMSAVVPIAVGSSFSVRVLISLISLLPLGLLMGMPFASGLSYLERVHPRFVPWAWGINGLTSVMASILAIILAMRFGFNLVVIVGGVVYLVGALALLLHAHRFSSSPTIDSSVGY